MKNEPAFPYEGVEVFQKGMTLRDYLAAKARQGWVASFRDEQTPDPKQVAELAYKIADAMLSEREKGGE